jgi:hypothetical protein
MPKKKGSHKHSASIRATPPFSPSADAALSFYPVAG